jgi:predicted dehydrogenase
MASPADLQRAVSATLTTHRIGRPVFVRYLSLGSNPSLALDSVLPVLAEWFGQPLECRHTTGPTEEEQVSFSLQTRNGALALLSFARTVPAVAGVDLTVLGTRGAIYHPLELPVADDFDETSPPSARKESRHGVLLVGGGRTHQEDYARAFAADTRCRLVAVTDEADIDAARRGWNEQLAQSLGLPYLPDLDAALRQPDVNIASVCVPPERRGRVAVRCALAGKHLYLDKSLAPRREEAQAILAAVEKAAVRSHMFSFISTPWARRAKRLLDSGALGKLVAIHADAFFAKGQAGTIHNPTVRREEHPPQRHQLVEAKRELDNVGVYPITLIRWLTGRAFATVFASTANFFFAEHERHNVEDFGVIAGTLADGPPVTIAAGRTGWLSHPAGGVNRLVLVGSERTVTIDANRPRLEVYASEPPWTPPPAHPGDPMAFWTSTQKEVDLRPKQTWLPVARLASDASYFLDRLDAGSDSELSANEAAAATDVLLAAYESAATGKMVTLERPKQ